MVVNISGIGLKIEYPEKANILGLMGENTRESGLTTICTVKAFIHGKMGENMKDTTNMIR